MNPTEQTTPRHNHHRQHESGSRRHRRNRSSSKGFSIDRFIKRTGIPKRIFYNIIYLLILIAGIIIVYRLAPSFLDAG